MTWEFLHGNSHETYTTLIDSIPDECKTLIPAATEKLMDYGVHGDPQHHSMAGLETSEGLMIMRSLCVRKHKAYSASYYVHKHVFSASPRTMLDHFEKVLTMPFSSEEEFERIAEGDRYTQPTLQWQEMEVRIHKEVLRAVLRGMIRCWRSGNNPVVVDVPAGVDYNSYCMGAIRKIYSYLPAAIRAKAGFMTYTVSAGVNKHTVLLFQPANTARNGIRLDHEDEQSQVFLDAPLPPIWIKMLDKLVDSTQEERKKFLDELCTWVETEPGTERFVSNLSGTHYISYLENKELLQPVETQAKFDQLLKYYQEKKGLPGRMFDQICSRLDETLSDMNFRKFALERRSTDTNFLEYAERLRKLVPLSQYSARKKEQIRSELRNQFDVVLAEANCQREPLQSLEKQVNTLIQNGHPFLTRQELEQYLYTVTMQMETHHIADAQRLCGAALAKYDTECTDKDDLEARDSHWDEIEKGLQRDLRNIPVDTRSILEQCKTEYHTKRRTYVNQLAECKSHNLNQDNYELEKKRLEDILAYMKRAGRTDLHAYIVEEALAYLTSRYTQYGRVAAEDLQNAMSRPDYFDSVDEVKKCIQRHSEQLKQMGKSDVHLHKELTAHREKHFTSLKDYRDAFNKHYNKVLDLKSIINLGGFSAEQIRMDWGALIADELIQIDGKSLIAVHDMIQEKMTQCAMLSCSLEKITLCCNESKTASNLRGRESTGEENKVAYPADDLSGTFDMFSGSNANSKFLNGKHRGKLLRQISYMAATEDEKRNIIRALRDKNVDEDMMCCALYYLYGKPDSVSTQKLRQVFNSNNYKKLMDLDINELRTRAAKCSGDETCTEPEHNRGFLQGIGTIIKGFLDWIVRNGFAMLIAVMLVLAVIGLCILGGGFLKKLDNYLRPMEPIESVQPTEPTTEPSDQNSPWTAPKEHEELDSMPAEPEEPECESTDPGNEDDAIEDDSAISNVDDEDVSEDSMENDSEDFGNMNPSQPKDDAEDEDSDAENVAQHDYNNLPDET